VTSGAMLVAWYLMATADPKTLHLDDSATDSS
jgi:hypothetical protein